MQRSLALRLREQNVRRLRLFFSEWIYEEIGPRYALRFFTTHVETGSAPISTFYDPATTPDPQLGREVCGQSSPEGNNLAPLMLFQREPAGQRKRERSPAC